MAQGTRTKEIALFLLFLLLRGRGRSLCIFFLILLFEELFSNNRSDGAADDDTGNDLIHGAERLSFAPEWPHRGSISRFHPHSCPDVFGSSFEFHEGEGCVDGRDWQPRFLHQILSGLRERMEDAEQCVFIGSLCFVERMHCSLRENNAEFAEDVRRILNQLRTSLRDEFVCSREMRIENLSRDCKHLPSVFECQARSDERTALRCGF